MIDTNIVAKIRARIDPKNHAQLDRIIEQTPHLIPRYHISINAFIRRTF